LTARAAAVALGVSVVLALSACTARHDVPTIDASASAGTPRSGSTPAPAVPPAPAPTETAPLEAADRELARFDAVNRRTVDRVPTAGGRAFIDGLAAAGYRRGAMQVTEDRTTIGLAVPSVQFSVLWRGVCLIGQHGPQSGGYRSTLAAPVDGRCLIGRTRAIDW
jgi:hypothetical protein